MCRNLSDFHIYPVQIVAMCYNKLYVNYPVRPGREWTIIEV